MRAVADGTQPGTRSRARGALARRFGGRRSPGNWSRLGAAATSLALGSRSCKPRWSDPPGPGQQRRLERCSHEVGARAHVVEQQPPPAHRLSPEDRVPDESVRCRCRQQTLELCAGSRRIKPAPGDGRKTRVPVPLPRITSAAWRGVGIAQPVAFTLAPVALEGTAAERRDWLADFSCGPLARASGNPATHRSGFNRIVSWRCVGCPTQLTELNGRSGRRALAHTRERRGLDPPGALPPCAWSTR